MMNQQPLTREELPLEATWNRESLFAGWEAWQTAYDAAVAELPQLGEFDGRFAEGPQLLMDWFTARDRHWLRMMKLFVYTSMSVNVDTDDQDAAANFGQAIALYSKFGAVTAYVRPQLLALGQRLDEWAASHPGLDGYSHYLHNLRRLQQHQRSAEVEALFSGMAQPFSGVSQAAQTLVNSDLRFADAVDSQGTSHPVRQATVTPTGIQSPDRQHRRQAWEHYADGYLGMQNTLARLYATSVQQTVFEARERGYGSVLEMMLSPSNLPVPVFHNLMDQFKANLPVWHRYWEAKRRLLRQESLQPYDIWAPVTTEPRAIPYGQAVDWICEAMAPLGDQYVQVMRRGCLSDRWVDYAPSQGKRQGAASSPRMDTPPFIFMSYDDTVMSMSVLAHELGHSMHSWFAWEHQLPVYNDFEGMSMSVAETASNFNQALLRHYLRQHKGDDVQLQIALIDEAMFNFHRYFFTMPTLARFEYEVYSRAERDQPLNAPILNEIMGRMLAEGYGETMTDDPERSAITWAQFGHLYMPFYTFQYAVGISAANALASRVLDGTPGAAGSYLSMLSAGSSRYPDDLFKLGGVDMSSSEPMERAFGVMSGLVADLERLAG